MHPTEDIYLHLEGDGTYSLKPDLRRNAQPSPHPFSLLALLAHLERSRTVNFNADKFRDGPSCTLFLPYLSLHLLVRYAHMHMLTNVATAFKNQSLHITRVYTLVPESPCLPREKIFPLISFHILGVKLLDRKNVSS